ncbi:MAG TPA: Fe-S cluster assembly protein NifU [Candidatus Krumholzibacteria bacterium]|nr:Fe-S cluster assembly protein NifU [Candidatus Krumholzibacteria bacterium]HPD72313.1 Fe-S cluster assembly protein NifU [Candidatus Krumholzibacteria bacterium]HRY40755.1 Fe-S cluster assembly protein NifU [Candidatus Krumholzibacteria bacterium]
MWNYSEKVMDHFLNPRNVGLVENPDGVGEVGSMACGDALRLSFRLDQLGRIADVKFQTFGCGSAIASSSILTEMIKGKTLEEAAQVTNEDIARELGGLPREKMHCSVMGREALEAAMIDHYKRLGRGVPCHLLSQGVLICHCYSVTRDTIREAVLQHDLATVEDVTNFTKAGGGCGDCHHDIEHIIAEVRSQRAGRGRPAPVQLAEPPDAAAAAAERALVKRIQDVLENDVAVALRNDGGDIELVRYNDGKVFVRLKGACAACRVADVTLKDYVEAELRRLVRGDLQVIEVTT